MGKKKRRSRDIPFCCLVGNDIKRNSKRINNGSLNRAGFKVGREASEKLFRCIKVSVQVLFE